MKNLKILLVDDEVEFVTTLAERLRIRGLQTKIAKDGEEALNMFDTSVFDVVLLDVFMPGMSGFDVLKEIKKRSSNIPVILLTGHGST
ncbi:MAG: response regulator [Desulfobacterales bacterium]|nr:response regulator [Desulfobacterales bacterium]